MPFGSAAVKGSTTPFLSSLLNHGDREGEKHSGFILDSIFDLTYFLGGLRLRGDRAVTMD